MSNQTVTEFNDSTKIYTVNISEDELRQKFASLLAEVMYEINKEYSDRTRMAESLLGGYDFTNRVVEMGYHKGMYEAKVAQAYALADMFLSEIQKFRFERVMDNLHKVYNILNNGHYTEEFRSEFTDKLARSRYSLADMAISTIFDTPELEIVQFPIPDFSFIDDVSVKAFVENVKVIGNFIEVNPDVFKLISIEQNRSHFRTYNNGRNIGKIYSGAELRRYDSLLEEWAERFIELNTLTKEELNDIRVEMNADEDSTFRCSEVKGYKARVVGTLLFIEYPELYRSIPREVMIKRFADHTHSRELLHKYSYTL